VCSQPGRVRWPFVNKTVDTRRGVLTIKDLHSVSDSVDGRVSVRFFFFWIPCDWNGWELEGKLLRFSGSCPEKTELHSVYTQLTCLQTGRVPWRSEGNSIHLFHVVEESLLLVKGGCLMFVWTVTIKLDFCNRSHGCVYTPRAQLWGELCSFRMTFTQKIKWSVNTKCCWISNLFFFFFFS